MTTVTDNVELIKKDRLRFSKNKLSSNLTLLAIVFNAIYFVSIYKSDVGSYYYTFLIGISIIYNLLFMLTAFLSSEGVKSYKLNYSFVLLGLGVGQIIRIFILPMSAHNVSITLGQETQRVMSDGQFMRICVYLIASAALCIIAGIVAYIKTRTLTSYEAELEQKAKGAGHE
ncbi:MAG: hypothetical protein HDT44_06525 [Ruminococcaceae bacterium]|nr:hypothetical protein [Oscillospiraceae bacterium]